MSKNKRIPWYEMPIHLRSLPFADREAALLEYESRFGPYDWEKDFDKENEND